MAAVKQSAKAARRRGPRIPRLSSLCEHRWSATERAIVIALLAIVSGSLFVTSYSLALGDPVPHRIDAALVGDPTGHTRTVDAVERVARGSLVFHRYDSVPAALHAIDEQHVYAALDLTSTRPTLYLASAAGASVARVLEQVSAVDPTVRVVDTHPLGTADPNGVETFYLMIVATIVGFLTVFQVRLNAGRLSLGRWTAFVVALAVAAALVFTLVDGPLLHRLDLPVPETWGILARTFGPVRGGVTPSRMAPGAVCCRRGQHPLLLLGCCKPRLPASCKGGRWGRARPTAPARGQRIIG